MAGFSRLRLERGSQTATVERPLVQRGGASHFIESNSNVRTVREIFPGVKKIPDADIIKLAEAVSAKVITNNVKDFGRPRVIPLPRTGDLTATGVEQFIKHYLDN